jgi:hypothetical protein
MLESVGSMSSDDERKQGIIHEGRAHDILIPSKHPGHLRHPWIPQRKRSLVLAGDQAGMAPAPGHQNDRYAASSRVLADYNSDVLCHGAVALHTGRSGCLRQRKRRLARTHARECEPVGWKTSAELKCARGLPGFWRRASGCIGYGLYGQSGRQWHECLSQHSETRWLRKRVGLSIRTPFDRSSQSP